MSRWRLGGWWPVALAGLLVAVVAVAQRPRGGLSSIFGQDVSPNSVTSTRLTVNGDAGVGKNVSIGGTLGVTGATTLTGTLTTTGNAVFNGDAGVAGALALKRINVNDSTGAVVGDLIGTSSILTLESANDADVLVRATGAGLAAFDGSSSVSVCGSTATSCSVGRSGITTTLAGPGNVVGTGSEFVFAAPVSLGSIGSGTIINQFTSSNAGLFRSGKFVSQGAGIGAGNLVIKLCSDGATCAAGKIYCAATLACTSVAGTVTTCTAVDATTYTAATTLTWAIITSCATDTIGVATAVLANN